MDYFSAFIYFIIAIKIGFILCAITHVYLKLKKKENSSLDKKVVYWKERFEFTFVFLMAFLLIYLFNPRTTPKNVIIEGETKLLLFLFGFVLLITANWDTFFHESKWFQTLQDIIGKKR